jgi:hypothetical protein
MGIRREIATCLDLLSGNKQREQKGKKEEQSAASESKGEQSAAAVEKWRGERVRIFKARG